MLSPAPISPARRPGGPERDEAGSGTAIGVVILFPALMLVIVSLSMLSESARIEQALQNVANRAARTASLCCRETGGPDGAEAVVRASLAAAELAADDNRVQCNNDFVGEATMAFVDAAGNDVPVDPGELVPPGGKVYVWVRCSIPPRALGGFGLPGLDARRTVMGVAAVDPYRSRAG